MKLITQNEGRPGYKETKIGWIPEEWEIMPLGQIGVFSKGKGITNSQKKKSGLPCITYGEIYTKHDFTIKEFNSFINQETAETSQLIQENDILFAGSGETLNEIGKCVTNPFNDKVFAGGDIVIFTPNGNDSLFLSFLINSNYITRFRRKLGQGHSVVHIYSSGLKTLNIPLPPLPEQKKIAAILSTWDKAIEKIDALNKAKEKLKKGLMQKLLTGKVRFPGFTEPWTEVVLGEICKINKGTQLNKINMIENGKYPVLNGGIDYSGFTDKWNMEKNTITISEGGNSCGFVNYMRERFWSGGHCYSLKGISQNSLFIFQLLKHIEIKIMRLRVGSGLPNIQKADIDKFKIKLPSLNEQNVIASVLSACDKEIEQLKKEKAAIKLQKKGLMQKLLTGSVRVKV